MGVQGTLTTVGIVIALVALAAPAGGQSPGDPKIALSQPSWDFGEVYHPAKPEFVLTVTNAGSAELRILKVESSCGCTIAQPAKYVLQAGEATTIKVIYDSKGRQGKVTSHLTIHSNDRSRPELLFRLRGVVKRHIEVNPFHGATFRLLDPHEFSSFTINFLNATSQPMQPRLGSFATDVFSAELREVRPGVEYEVIVSYRRPIATRTHHDKIEVLTGLDAEPRIEVSAYATVIDRVSASPPATFVKPNSARRIERKVRIQYYGQEPGFQVLQVVCDDPNIKVRLGPPEPPIKAKVPVLMPTKVISLYVDLPPAALLPPGGVPVRIFTNDPEYPEITFIVTANRSQFQQLIRDAKEVSQRRKAP